MKRVHGLWLVVVVAVALVTGLAVTSLGGDDASAQSEKRWSIASAEYICESCSLFELTQGQGLYEFAEEGDPKGDMRMVINIIAKLEQDGCEWQWLPSSGKPIILFRCN